MLLVAAGSGVATLNIPGSAGVPAAAVRDTLLAPYNDADAVAKLFAAHPGQIAAFIVEPVAGNMGCIPPRPGYLEALREITTREGAVLIFDEVMTGFRVAPGGAQERFGVTPDLTCLGKIVGGGMPVGAYGGKREIMSTVAPLGPVYQAGTLSGNPLSVAAGLETLKQIKRDKPHEALEAATTRLCEGLAAHAKTHGIDWTHVTVGSMFGFFFQAEPVWNYEQAKRSDNDRFVRFHSEMLARGVYFAPSQFEAAFLSTAHDDAAIDQTLAAADAVFAVLPKTLG
jgi:glutamate-1-semialdehyde 2,1-aminomutase